MARIIRNKKVTCTRADRVLLAIAALIECDDFQEVAARAGFTGPVGILDDAAELARAMRNEVAK